MQIKKWLFPFLFIFFACGTVRAITMPDTSLSVSAIKLVLQGVWAGPDESYYFLFRGDSVKEWEADGSDSSSKPFCNYYISKIACDTNHIEGSTGFYMSITCKSTDYDETKCYFIQSINTIDLMLGTNGKYEESGHFKKVQKKEDGGN